MNMDENGWNNSYYLLVIYIYGCESKCKAPIHTLNPQADPYPRSIPKRRWSRPFHTSGSPRADPYPNFDATPYISWNKPVIITVFSNVPSFSHHVPMCSRLCLYQRDIFSVQLAFRFHCDLLQVIVETTTGSTAGTTTSAGGCGRNEPAVVSLGWKSFVYLTGAKRREWMGCWGCWDDDYDCGSFLHSLLSTSKYTTT